MASLTRGLRVLTVLAGVAGALAALGWYTVWGQTACEVCVVYHGREACRTVSATSSAKAERAAQATACALVTGGVTEALECERTPPTVARCE